MGSLATISDTLNCDKAQNAVAAILPQAHKKQAERFIKRAILTISTMEEPQKTKVLSCSPASVMEAVLLAAECGFAIDNRFAYIIPYGTHAQCQFDYKALIALARRSGAIVDIRPQVIKQKDAFEMWEENGHQYYKFVKHQGDSPGETVGAFCVVVMKDHYFKLVHMNRKELDMVQAASKSPNSPAWKNWQDRMHCKAVVKRGLNGLLDDPGLIQAIGIDNQEYDLEKPLVANAPTSSISAEMQSIQPARIEQPQDEPERQEPSEIIKTFGQMVGVMDSIEDIKASCDSACDNTVCDETKVRLEQIANDRIAELETN